MESKQKERSVGTFGMIIGVLVVVVSVIVVALFSSSCDDERANEELTWVG